MNHNQLKTDFDTLPANELELDNVMEDGFHALSARYVEEGRDQVLRTGEDEGSVAYAELTEEHLRGTRLSKYEHVMLTYGMTDSAATHNGDDEQLTAILTERGEAGSDTENTRTVELTRHADGTLDAEVYKGNIFAPEADAGPLELTDENVAALERQTSAENIENLAPQVGAIAMEATEIDDRQQGVVTSGDVKDIKASLDLLAQVYPDIAEARAESLADSGR
jgi:hypothetical protein